MEIKNLKKTANRIQKAIKKRENIILYGDADLDGVTSVIILKETLKNLGGNVVSVYFPDREKEGYGINENALNFLSQFSPALLITLDCGIGNFKEVKLAKNLGFEVIIIDHHEILEKLPEASIIVDPKQEGDKYPFKGLATAGITFKLSQLILGENLSENLKKGFLELVALATIADMMPQEDENKIFIEEGLSFLENSWRPGLKAFLEMNEIKNYGAIREIAQKIVSVLNVTDSQEDYLVENYLLLTSASIKEAKMLAKNLLEKSYQRHERIKEIIKEVKERVLEKINEPIIFEGDKNWLLTSTGPVASKICNLYKKATFIFKIGETQNQGAVRMPQGLDGVKAMISCSKLLETYGGHPVAAGFRIKNENLEKFKECLINYFSKL